MSTPHQLARKLFSFIRMSSVNIGQVEKVTWIRQKDGTLLCVIAPFKAGAMDLAKMAMSPEGEAFI